MSDFSVIHKSTKIFLGPWKVGWLTGYINDFIKQPLKYLYAPQRGDYINGNKTPSTYYLFNSLKSTLNRDVEKYISQHEGKDSSSGGT